MFRSWIVLVALVCVGCVTLPEAWPPSQPLRANLGRIVVEPAGAAERPSAPPRPISEAHEAMGYGAGKAVAGLFSGVSGTRTPLDLVIYLAFAVVAAPAVAVVGGASGLAIVEDRETIERADANLAAVLEGSSAERTIVERLHALLAARGQPAFLVEEEVEADSRLWIHLRRFSLGHYGRLTPSIWLDLTVDAEIRCAADGRTVFAQSWRLLSDPKEYFALAEEGGAGLRSLIDTSTTQLAQAIHDHLFVATKPDPMWPATPEVGRRGITIIGGAERAIEGGTCVAQARPAVARAVVPAAPAAVAPPLNGRWRARYNGGNCHWESVIRRTDNRIEGDLTVDGSQSTRIVGMLDDQEHLKIYADVANMLVTIEGTFPSLRASVSGGQIRCSGLAYLDYRR